MDCFCPILERVTSVEETGFGRNGWSLVRCRETGFVFLPNPPEYSQLECEFAWESTSDQESKRREFEEPIFSKISAMAKATKLFLFPRRNKTASLTLSVARGYDRAEPLSVLDLGCGWGSLLVEIHDRAARTGRQVALHGIEISKRLAGYSEGRVAPLGGRILSTNALDGISSFENQSVNLVTMCSFLEHEARPLRLLRQLHPILATGGSVILKVPNFACWNRRLRGQRWCGFRFPDHVNYFTPDTLQRLAHEAGYTVSRQSFGDRLPISDNMYAVLTKDDARAPAPVVYSTPVVCAEPIAEPVKELLEVA